ncbi:hypothetical protein MBLNU459_g3898t1 [Dothideomycetes sp. NU459]
MQGSNNFIHSNSFKQQQSGNQFSVTDDPAVKPLTNDERRTTNNATKNAKKSPRGWNRPSPTKSYLSRARAEPTLLQEPQRLLVILDLNGVLVHRKKSRTGHVERPDLKVFLDYLFANHYVMVWSSGMPGNVTAICDKIFTPKQRKALVGVWGRDTLRLPTSLFREKVQVYKQLAWVWQDQAVKAKVLSSELPIDAEHMPGFNQGNTVLIDDSAEKAASEPHNLIEVDEFGGRPDEMQGTVLSQVVEYLEKARCAEDQWETSLAAHSRPSLAFGPLSHGFNRILFWMVLYFYNVDAMLMLFWAIALTFGVWDWRIRSLDNHRETIGLVSKAAAFVLPVLQITGLHKAYQIDASIATSIVLLNLLSLTSFAIGTVCITLIMFKYMRSRFGVSSYASGSTPSGGQSTITTSRSRRGLPKLTMRVDPWLVVRFTIAFFIISGFEVFQILFDVGRYNRIHNMTAPPPAPDFSAAATIKDFCGYLPGVTVSLLAFLLFGTTAHHRALYLSVLTRLRPPRRLLPTITRVHGDVADWSRMSGDDESRDTQRYKLHNGRIESIELGRTGAASVRPPSPSLSLVASMPPAAAKAGAVRATVFDYGSPVSDTYPSGSGEARFPVRKLGVLEDCDSGV